MYALNASHHHNNRQTVAAPVNLHRIRNSPPETISSPKLSCFKGSPMQRAKKSQEKLATRNNCKETEQKNTRETMLFARFMDFIQFFVRFQCVLLVEAACW